MHRFDKWFKFAVKQMSSILSCTDRIKKPVFREKHRNTGFYVTYRKNFELHICSPV